MKPNTSLTDTPSVNHGIKRRLASLLYVDGTIVGEHEIIFAGHDEVMEIRHIAHSREIFAKGLLKPQNSWPQWMLRACTI